MHRSRTSIPPSLARWAAFSLALASLGCSGDKPAAPAESTARFAREETFGPGPVRLVVRLEKTTIDLSERVLLELELHAKQGFIAEFPEYLPEDFEGFSVVRISYPDGEPPGEVGADGTGGPSRYRKRMLLEPDRSGTLTVHELFVYFREADAKEESYFQTEPLELEVKGLESLGNLAVSRPREVFEAPALEVEDHRLLWAAGGVLVLAAATLAYLLLTGRERQAPPAPPAHEIAYEALRRLVAQDLIGRGEIELFFVYLSAIVREYIENRFDVHAPERTTEEFLVEASRAPALERYRDRLGEFLRLSDQVKFARFHPEEGAIQQSFDAVKHFIAETRADVA